MQQAVKSPSRTKFVCLIGAQKAGTTSVFRYLAEHSEVHAIDWKESKYFLVDEQSPSDEAFYQSCCSDHQPKNWLFEVSTYYTKHPTFTGVAKRIYDAHPSARLVYMIRNPIDRLWSQYVDALSMDRERLPFAEAIRTNSDYLNFSRYHLQLSQYLEYFPREQILVELFEDFRRSNAETMKRLTDFLQIDDQFEEAKSGAFNVTQGKRAVTPSLRLFRAIPGYKKIIPWRVRKILTSMLGNDMPQKAEALTPETRSWILEQLRPDIDALHDLLSPEKPLWPALDSVVGSGS